MQPDRTVHPAFDASDPASSRLSRDDVIAINRAHLAGVGWDQIAADHGTNRKNVQRIVQGRRHRSLHPNEAPELYGPTPATQEPEPVVVIVNAALRDARDRILKELREAA